MLENDITVELIGKSRIENQFLGSFCAFKIMCAFDYEFYRHSSTKNNFIETTKIIRKSPYVTFYTDPSVLIRDEDAYHMIQAIRRALEVFYYKPGRYFYNSVCHFYGFINDFEYYFLLFIEDHENNDHNLVKLTIKGRPTNSTKKKEFDFEWCEVYLLRDMYYLIQLMKNALHSYSISSY
jgi:hypothetical protein